MAKATTGGVTDQNVHPDYVAPAGMPPADALDQGIEDAATGEQPKAAPDAPDTGQQQRPEQRGEERTGAQKDSKTTAGKKSSR